MTERILDDPNLISNQGLVSSHQTIEVSKHKL